MEFCRSLPAVSTSKFSSVCATVAYAFAFVLVITVPSTTTVAQSVQDGAGSDAAAHLSGAAAAMVQVEGELEVIYQDFKDRSRLSYNLMLPNGTRLPLQFINQAPARLLNGEHVQVSGEMSGGSLVLYSGSTNVQNTSSTTTTTTSIPVPNTFGPQPTLVILVNFQDYAVQPYTVADAQNTYAGAVNNFLTENSYGQTSISPTVVGWYTIPDSVTTCNISQIATDAEAAAVAGGANLSNYTRYVYMFPLNTNCGWGGSSNVGGNPSRSWINGNSLDFHTLVHELGHAFGLWHSHLLNCGTNATVCSNGTVVEYGDILDVMGQSQTASPDYNAFQKERLGWLNYGASPAIITVTTSGTYTISPFELAGGNPKALKILKSTDSMTGAKTWYYLEARQALGFDAFLINPVYYTQNETTGVLFHIGTDVNGNTSSLHDMTPATSASTGWFDASLAVGQSLQDSATGVTFTTQSVTSAGATVNVQFSASSPSIPQSIDSLTVTTDQASYSLGQTVTTTATATAGGAPVANVSVNFTVTKSNGSTVKGSATTGNNGVAVYKYRLRKSDPPGTYGAAASAVVQANPVSAATNFTVQ